MSAKAVIQQDPGLTLRVRRAQSVSVMVITPARIVPRAVERNKIRRQIKEVFRRLSGIPPGSYTFTVIRRGIFSGNAADQAVLKLIVESGIVVR